MHRYVCVHVSRLCTCFDGFSRFSVHGHGFFAALSGFSIYSGITAPLHHLILRYEPSPRVDSEKRKTRPEQGSRTVYCRRVEGHLLRFV
jgi:hypothetical protein